MTKRITVLPGDGIGPEVTAAAVQVLTEVARLFEFEVQFDYAKIGGVAIDEEGTPLPDETVARCRASDAVLLGAVGGPKWDTGPGSMRPEAGLLGIRKALGLFANLRPVQVFPSLQHASTLKPEALSGVDLMIVRELTGGIYFGQPRERRVGEHGLEVVDTLLYTESEMERIIRLGFELARQRKSRLTSVDKANVLESSRLWRETADRLAGDYPDVTLSHMLVDNAAMQLVKHPAQFDVVVTENLFGDILSDEAAMITGSIGLLPSASLGDGGPGLFEPVHGSAPDIAGKSMANPLATLLSVSMMLKYAFQHDEAAEALESAIRNVLDHGFRTADMATSGEQSLSTQEMTQKVIEGLAR